jgi:hypothetical protein
MTSGADMSGPPIDASVAVDELEDAAAHAAAAAAATPKAPSLMMRVNGRGRARLVVLRDVVGMA